MARKVALEPACRYSNQSQRKIGEYCGYEGNGLVLKQRQRLTELMNDDKQMSEKVVRSEKKRAKS